MPEVSDDINEARSTISVVITYDYELNDFFIKSGFENPQHTIKCIQLGLQKYLDEIEKLSCPFCNSEVKSNWLACPNCGKDL